MHQVIDLLSSPTNSPPKIKQTVHQQARGKPPPCDISIYDSDEFNFLSSDDVDLLSEQPKKKRRLSLPDPKPSKAKPSHRLSFLSSDDLDDAFDMGKTSIGKTTAVTSTTRIEELPSDPITFSSSAPEPRTVSKAANSAIIDLEADDFGGDFGFSFSQPPAPTRTHLSERTANLLANIAVPGNGSNKYKSVGHTVTRKTSVASITTLKTTNRLTAVDDVLTSSPPKPRAKSSKAAAKDKDAREAERAAARAKKEEEKEAERERKRLAKEDKARQRQLAADIAEVNKSKIDKKNSTPEMILDMARSLEGTSVGNQVLEYMEILGVETTFFVQRLDLIGSSETVKERGNLLRWRRKLKANYNEEVGHWEPIPVEKIEVEKHILLHITAQEFLEIAASGLPRDQEAAAQEEDMIKHLDAHVASLRSRYKDCKPIYLIESLATFLRKNKNAKNRAYTAAVRSQIADNDDQAIPPTSSQPRRKRKNNNPANPPIDLSFITPDLTETLLLHLQLHSKILIHQSATPSLSAEWIKSFTEHISTIPYRHLRMSANDAVGFCMDVGQVKTGDDRLDTYVKMLQEVQRVTPAMAYGIANQYGTVGELVGAFKREGPLALQGIRKSANRDGAVSERVLGQMVSKRLYKVWMGRDEGSTDGIA